MRASHCRMQHSVDVHCEALTSPIPTGSAPTKTMGSVVFAATRGIFPACCAPAVRGAMRRTHRTRNARRRSIRLPEPHVRRAPRRPSMVRRAGGERRLNRLLQLGVARDLRPLRTGAREELAASAADAAASRRRAGAGEPADGTPGRGRASHGRRGVRLRWHHRAGRRRRRPHHVRLRDRRQQGIPGRAAGVSRQRRGPAASVS